MARKTSATSPSELEYYIVHKKKIVYGPTADFFAVLDKLKTMGCGCRLMRTDGEPLAFNPNAGVPTRTQYAQMKKNGDEGDSEEVPG
jgi:hypothetical protein